ncbi:hypothetical protein LX36DRAFT_143968 [Colletotrichum falcatum]|nr:hypothetical protein LX36DRAFT_143968 [Colletotrichum falcatum]
MISSSPRGWGQPDSLWLSYLAPPYRLLSPSKLQRHSGVSHGSEDIMPASFLPTENCIRTQRPPLRLVVYLPCQAPLVRCSTRSACRSLTYHEHKNGFPTITTTPSASLQHCHQRFGHLVSTLKTPVGLGRTTRPEYQMDLLPRYCCRNIRTLTVPSVSGRDCRWLAGRRAYGFASRILGCDNGR